MNKKYFVSAAMMLLWLLTAVPAHAGALVVSLSPVAAIDAGSTDNSFDVLLTNSSTPAVSIAAFFFEIQSSSADITFTDVTTGTLTPYIFGADSLFGPDIIGPGSTATDVNASDLDLGGSISLDGGTTVALGHVFFDISPSALSQTVSLTIVGFPGTSLADDSGADVPIQTLTGGQFTINGAESSVPEPSLLVPLFAIVPVLLAVRRRMLQTVRR